MSRRTALMLLHLLLLLPQVAARKLMFSPTALPILQAQLAAAFATFGQNEAIGFLQDIGVPRHIADVRDSFAQQFPSTLTRSI